MNVDLLVKLLDAAPFRPFTVHVPGFDPVAVADPASARFDGRTKSLAVTLPGGSSQVLDVGAIAGVSVSPAPSP